MQHRTTHTPQRFYQRCRYLILALKERANALFCKAIYQAQ
jgi:hypothetical protein